MDKTLIASYEQVLLGKQKMIAAAYFRSKSDSVNERNILILFRYGFENLLRWSPEEVRDNITLEIIDKRLLLRPYLRFIQFPPELDKFDNLWYLACAAYPTQIKYDWYKFTIECYEAVLSGKKKRFPKGFFDESRGEMRACFCLRHKMNNEMQFISIEDVYRTFGSVSILKTLKKWKLLEPLNEIYNGNPIEFLSDAMPEKSRDEFWYHFYHFKFDEEWKNQDIRNLYERSPEQEYLEMNKEDFTELAERIRNMSFRAAKYLPERESLQRQIRENPKKYATFLLWLSLTADEPDVEDPECLLKDDILKYIKDLASQLIVINPDCKKILKGKSQK